MFSCFEALIGSCRFKKLLSEILCSLIQNNNGMNLHISKSILSFWTQLKNMPFHSFSDHYSITEYPREKNYLVNL